LLSIAGFTGATILCFFKDGHAPSLLAGALLSLILQRDSHDLLRVKNITSPQLK
jgi:hypothetical protein